MRTALAGLALVACSLVAAASASASRVPATLTPRLAAIAGDQRFKRPAERVPGPVQSAGGDLARQGRRYVVDVTYARGAKLNQAALRRAGARVVAVSRPYRTVTVAAPAARLGAIGGVSGVQTVAEDLTPMVNGATKRRDACQGSVVSEGDGQLRARRARAKFGVDGSGVTVGVLSNSFDASAGAATHAADDVASHDLPGPGDPCGHDTPVSVLQDTNSADEGRAMLQVVHDLAPGANLDFATATPSETTFANNITALANAGADVILDDVTYFDEPFFQDGPISNAVNDVRAEGVSYFSSAANYNVVAGPNRNAGSFEAPGGFRDAGSCPSALPAYAQHCMDFNPSSATDRTYGITIGAGRTLTLDLQWAQPWFGVSTDLDMYVISNGMVVRGLGTAQAHNAEGESAPTHRPFEFVRVTNTGDDPANVNIAINRCDSTCGASRGGGGGDGAAPRLKFVFLDNNQGSFPNEYVTSAGGDIVGPAIFGHNGAAGALSTAAVPYDDSSMPEDFSSPGPVTHYFGPTAGTTPAALLATPHVLKKPDLAATDCGLTTFFSSNRPAGSFFRFCGTSEAAPHAGAVAALQLQENPSATPARIERALTRTARSVGTFGHTDVGAGLIDAVGAVDEMAAPKLAITSHPARETTSRRATLRFASSEPAALRCSLDGDSFKPCNSPMAYAHLTVGRHTFRVRGKDGVGRVGKPARFNWRIAKRVHHR